MSVCKWRKGSRGPLGGPHLGFDACVSKDGDRLDWTSLEILTVMPEMGGKGRLEARAV